MRHDFVPLLILTLFLLVLVPIPTNSHIIVSETGENQNNTYWDSDMNFNKIDDKIETKFNQDLIEVVIHYEENTPLPHAIYGQPISYQFQSLHAVRVDLSQSGIQELSNSDEVEFIEFNHKYSSLLLDSTRNLGLPSSFWKDGQFSANGMSIAVIDSGIDSSHSGFQDRVIASYNAINDNATPADDTVGHGTHVAGIAAGSLNITDSSYTESTRGIVPPACGSNSCPLALGHQLQDFTAGQQITVKMDWAGKGGDNPGSEAGFAVFDPNTGDLACDDCFVTDTTGIIQTTLSLDAGSYYIGILNEAGAEGDFFESSVTYDKNELDSSSQIQGVAYGANIVNVKVLDGLSGGELETFDRAVTWVVDNRETYNISVVNLSLGLNSTSASLDQLMGTLADNGILPVAAAGNSGLTSGGVYSPASAPEALTVGAVNRIGEIAYYTNQGSSQINGDTIKPDVLAPGGSVASTALGFETDYELGFGMILSMDANIPNNLAIDDLTGFQGTSMAAPHVAGMALLMAGQIHATEGWDWNSRQDVMDIKRAILTGTYEVGNIGNGREQLPGERNPLYPEITRNAKDFQEGWGAVDARAVYRLFGDIITSGFSQDLIFDLEGSEGQKTYAYRMALEANVNYGFFAEVASHTDIDIKIIDAENKGVDDDGDLTILAYTSNGIGENEGLGFSVEESKEVFVVVTVIESSAAVSIPFSVTELAKLPTVAIQSPFEGQEVVNPVTVEFSSSTPSARLFVDGQPSGTITSGDQLDELSLGEHTITLEIEADGITARDSITFEVVEDTSDGFLNIPLLFFMSSLMMIHLFRRKISNQF